MPKPFVFHESKRDVGLLGHLDEANKPKEGLGLRRPKSALLALQKPQHNPASTLKTEAAA